MNNKDLGLQQTPHLSVLYNEVLNALQPRAFGKYLDGTLGAGGHAAGILQASSPDGQLLGLDVDPQALTIARQRLFSYGARQVIRQASYTQAHQIISEIGWRGVDGILLDLGVSSMQLDTAERGFSFQQNAPLDMRFSPDQRLSAADIVNGWSESDLANLIWQYGDEKLSRRIASAITKARPILNTIELATLILKVCGRKQGQIHPATRTFQALRIAVNQELQNIEKALPELVQLLNPGGRIAVIAFHSLEDRLVKTYFRRESQDCVCPSEQPICTCAHKATLKILTRRPVEASEAEISVNPRARSARLRAAEKMPMA